MRLREESGFRKDGLSDRQESRGSKMMTSHVKLRKEKGSLAEYESQMKGKLLWMCMCVLVSVCVSGLYHTSVHACALDSMHECIEDSACAFMHERVLCKVIQP